MNDQSEVKAEFQSIRKKQYFIVTPIVCTSVLMLILIQADLIDISFFPGLWMILATIGIF